MKKLLFVAAGFILTAGAMAQTSKPDDFAKFNTIKYDFGKIKQSVPVTYYFEVTNTSDKPLVIENAHATCGCTTPEYQKDAILPGKTAKIKVGYNAVQGGHFDKPVYVKFAGVQEEKVLAITGEVLTEESYNNWVKEEAAKAAAEKEKEKTTKSKNKAKNKSGK